MALTHNLSFIYWSVRWSRLSESSLWESLGTRERETTLSRLCASWTIPWYNLSWVVSVYSGAVKVCFWSAVKIYFWRGYVIISTSFEATTPDFHFSIKVIILSLFAMASTPKWLNYMCSIMSVGIGQNYTLLLFHLYYAGEKECGVHSSFPCIYTRWKRVCPHCLFPVYIQGKEECTPHTLSLLYIYWNVVMEIGYTTEALQCP